MECVNALNGDALANGRAQGSKESRWTGNEHRGALLKWPSRIVPEEQLKAAPEPWEFRSKPAWQRLIVMLGGIIVNVVVGILIFVGMTYFLGDTKGQKGRK